MSDEEVAKTDNLKKVVGPDEQTQQLSDEEFLIFAKRGYNFIAKELDPHYRLKRGTQIDIMGDVMKIATNPREVLDSFKVLSKEDLKQFILAGCAKIGVEMTYLNLAENTNILELTDAKGKALDEKRKKNLIKSNLKVIEGTAAFYRELIRSRPDLDEEMKEESADVEREHKETGTVSTE